MISLKIIVFIPMTIFVVSAVIAGVSSNNLHNLYLSSEDEDVEKYKDGENKVLSHFYFSEGFYEYVNNYESKDPVFTLLKRRIKKCLFTCALSFISIIPASIIYVLVDH